MNAFEKDLGNGKGRQEHLQPNDGSAVSCRGRHQERDLSNSGGKFTGKGSSVGKPTQDTVPGE